MGNRLVMTAQLHQAISTVLANGLQLDLEAEAVSGGRAAALTIRAHRASSGVVVRYCPAPSGEEGVFRADNPTLCGGDHRTIDPFLDALARQPDRWLRAPQYAPLPQGGFEPSEAWQLLLA